jgi:hypothetical protein
MRLVYRLTTATMIAAAVLTFGYMSLRAGVPITSPSAGQPTASATNATREDAFAACLKSQADGCEFLWMAPSD